MAGLNGKALSFACAIACPLGRRHKDTMLLS